MKQFLYQIAVGEKKGLHIELIKIFLWILSFLYLFLVSLRSFMYKCKLMPTVKLPKSVISIGNITTGGVGKTPLVAYLAEEIKKTKKPAVLMRGYMGEVDAPSDEAHFLKETLKDTPILVGENRVFEARKFLNGDSCDAFILDDGFQHIRLQRDLNIVVIDTTNPWGGGHLIPRGLLREPLDALKRADIYVLSKTDEGASFVEPIEAKLKMINPGAPIIHGVHKPKDLINVQTAERLPLESLSGRKIVAFSSIGSPRSFKHSLNQCKADIVNSFDFLDHHFYREEDITLITDFCKKENVTTAVTTQKDQAKMDHLLKLFGDHIQLLALRIRFTITKNEDALLKRIHHIL